MIKGIGHVAYTVSDMEKSLNFYCHCLGFKKAFELNNENGEPWINYLKIRDGQFIELFYGGTTRVELIKGAATYSHLCLEVDDLYKTVDNLKSIGIHIDTEPRQGSDMNYQAWIKDPDGNRIELMQLSPNSPQNKA